MILIRRGHTITVCHSQGMPEMEEGATKQDDKADAKKLNSKKDKRKKALERPIIAEQPTELRLTRRNLLMVSFVYLYGLTFGVDYQSFLTNNGVKFQGNQLDWAILLISIYLLISFIWKFIDFYRSQIILKTGILEIYDPLKWNQVTEKRHFTDPTQYTLSGWWGRTSVELEKCYSQLEEHIKNLKQQPKEFHTQLNDISNQIQSVNKVLQTGDAPKLNETLESYDKSVLRFIISQRLRVNIVDFGIPFFIGIANIGVCFIQIIFI